MPVSGWLSWLPRNRQRESDGVNCSPITLTEGNSTGSSGIRKVEWAYIPGYDPVISRRRTPIITTNGVIEAPRITVEGIRWGELEARSADVVCHNAADCHRPLQGPALGLGRPVEGLAGQSRRPRECPGHLSPGPGVEAGG
jgi:hypothetical protein